MDYRILRQTLISRWEVHDSAVAVIPWLTLVTETPSTSKRRDDILRRGKGDGQEGDGEGGSSGGCHLLMMMSVGIGYE